MTAQSEQEFMTSQSCPPSVEFLDEQASEAGPYLGIWQFHEITLAMRGNARWAALRTGVSRAVGPPARLSPARSGEESLDSQPASPGAGWGSGLFRHRLLRAF